MAYIYTIGRPYRNKLAQKTSAFWRRRYEYCGTTPGWVGDDDQRRFRLDKWLKRPQKAIYLYHRLRALR